MVIWCAPFMFDSKTAKYCRVWKEHIIGTIRFFYQKIGCIALSLHFCCRLVAHAALCYICKGSKALKKGLGK